MNWSYASMDDYIEDMMESIHREQRYPEQDYQKEAA